MITSKRLDKIQEMVDQWHLKKNKGRPKNELRFISDVEPNSDEFVAAAQEIGLEPNELKEWNEQLIEEGISVIKKYLSKE